MKEHNSEWLSISDMMSGLMLIFMFISMSYMLQVESDKDKMKEIAVAYNKDKKELNRDLNKIFEKDLKRWNAEITKDNIVRFNAPEVLFATGKSNLSSDFQKILDQFFPKYIDLLSSKKYKDTIDEIRVEGHTSNKWESVASPALIYLKNMKLSQQRANEVLTYCYELNSSNILDKRGWLEKKFRANGMSSAKMIYKDNGEEDDEKSKRVEFTVKMKTEDKIYQILEASN